MKAYPDRDSAIVQFGGSQDGALEVVVVYTGAKATLQALKTASALAEGLSARIRLLVPHIVPYPLKLEEPDVPVDFTERRFLTIATHAKIETTVDVVLGRDQWEMMESALKPHSVVVLAGRRRWWPTRESRIARRLKRLGRPDVQEFVGLRGTVIG